MNRILVADDDNMIRAAISTYLGHCGYQVLTACNGLEAVQVFRSCPDFIDLVLTDLRMPVMTGNDAVQQIWETRPDAKVICMTGYSDDECPKGAFLLQKPFKFESLREAVRQVIEWDVAAREQLRVLNLTRFE